MSTMAVDCFDALQHTPHLERVDALLADSPHYQHTPSPLTGAMMTTPTGGHARLYERQLSAGLHTLDALAPPAAVVRGHATTTTTR